MSAHVTPFNQLEVTPGHIYTAGAHFLRETTSSGNRLCHVEINWYDSGAVVISTETGNSVNDGATHWTSSAVTAVAPAGAVSAELLVVVAATGGAGERHQVDAVHFVEGEQTGWSPGTG
jgi:hypothetical protein